MATYRVPGLSGERFSVIYGIAGTETEARERAEHIRHEQTVEFPPDLLPAGDIPDVVVGRLEDFTQSGPNYYQALISYAVETAGEDLVQFLNVVFGNISIKPGVRVERIVPPLSYLNTLRGPRFGQDGLRALTGVTDRPLICTALKPMGLSAEAVAEQAYQFALGGIDIIKDDHGLADQKFCSFDERVARCSDAVARANAKTGFKSIYMPNVTAPYGEIQKRSEKAKKAGAGGFLLCPGLVGLDVVRYLSENDDFALPIMAHPAFLGSYVTSDQNGLSHYALFGQLMRLAGADATVFPNYGGRFSFSKEECQGIARGCSEAMGEIKSIFPTPGGGMTTDRAQEMIEVYGKDFVLLIGGGLHRHGPDLVENSRYFLRMLENL
ncbi:RuBisCO large subunit C-terminal-like domain-containing protein [Alkalispirochaeta alkalica]|uniref:RuBisCO large subunit C-terminal-like domain-containing protein n=1 Tax=Alkalispirochaeta alkalica TaxID=46356 RepID=UPI0003829AB0|nr:RuBisCO large subunit C-terminal-like domain-containing protein [Alkalispirochaeta alkalica]